MITDPIRTDGDPPGSFDIATERFQLFLSTQGYPCKVSWITSGATLVDRQHHFWIRSKENSGLRDAQQLYSEGLRRKLGIELRAVCCSDLETFGFVFVPKDDLDRQCHLMGPCLKLSCPSEKFSASKVGNPIKWLWLRVNPKQRSQHFRID
jgi:hypothetical protein